MSTVQKKPGSGRLGTRLRGKLQDDYQVRGKRKYALWYVYSPKARRDLVLHGDLRYGHFLHAESDPTVACIDYLPKARVADIAGKDIGDCIDAELRLHDGTIVWRSVRSASSVDKSAAVLANLQLLVDHRTHKDLPARLEVVTEREVYAQPERIRNWNRVLPWIAQARELPLHEYGNEVATLLHTRREIRLSDVMALGDERTQALYVAALFHGLQYGSFQSDLNEQHLSTRSRFFVREAS